MKRLADIAIDQDGEELVFRVKLARSLRSVLASILEPRPVVESVATHEIDVESIAVPRELKRANEKLTPPAPMAAPTRNDDQPPKSKHEQARDELDRQIADFYLSAEEPSIADCAARFRVGKQRVLSAFARTGTTTRPKGRVAGVTVADMKAKRDAKRELANKPPPLHVPTAAPRKPYKPPPPEKGQGKEAYRRALARHFRSKKLDLSPEEQQRLVDEHFAKGGAITEVPAAHANHALRYQSSAGTSIGQGSGRKRGAT